MAILQDKTFIGGGIVKELEGSAMELILQNLQQDHYQYPEKAFIREITSNCTDSLEEKSVARDILTGKSKVEDHYVQKVDNLTKDSQFDPDYYNLKFLNPEDKIKIVYENRAGNRDRITISDTGVGLGGERLKGYMRPAYSSKRLNKKALGKFGIGSKAGLATGVESFQMTTCHNGRKYSFDIYSDRYFSTTPKFDDEGQLNPHEIWKVKVREENGEIVEKDLQIFYEETTEFNSVVTSIDVKNPVRKKHTYFEAIKTQLAYFENVEVIEIEEDGYEKKHNIAAEILYRDENIVIPREEYYTVPHIVLNNVIYGPVDYAELELTQPRCSIGLILDPNNVDVNHSRESVRWTDKTRNSIISYNDKIKDIAFSYLTREVDKVNDNFIKWLKICKEIRTQGNNTVLTRLSGMVDTSLIDFEFPGSEGKIKFSIGGFKTLFRGFTLTKTLVNKHPDGTFSTHTVSIKEWKDFAGTNLFLRSSTEVSIKAVTMGYIAENLIEGNAVYMLTPNPKDLEGLSFAQLSSTKDRMSRVKKVLNEANNGVMYDDILPTSEFLAEYAEKHKKKEEREKKEREEADMTAAEIRKRDGKLLIHYVKHRGCGLDFADPNAYGTTRDEIEINDVSKLFNREDTIFFHKNQLSLVKILLPIFPNNGGGNYYGRVYGKEESLKLIMVAQDAAKFVNQYATNIKTAIQNFQNNTLTVMNPIQKYITGKTFRDAINSLNYSFLPALREIDVEAFRSYTLLKAYAEKHGDKQEWSEKITGSKEVDTYFKNLVDFQIFVTSTKNKDKIAEVAQKMFGNSDIHDCKVLDIERYARFKALEDYIEPIKGLLRGLNINAVDSGELKEYLKFKGVSPYVEYLRDRYDEFNVPEDERGI